MLKKIQEIEKKFRTEEIEIDGEVFKLEEGETLIDYIGFEAHLTTEVDLDEMENAFNEVISEIGLPIEITELDVACVGQDLENEIKKQGEIFRKIMDMIQSYPEIVSLTIWSQSDECSFMNSKLGRIAYASLLNKFFVEKEIPEKNKGKDGRTDCFNAILPIESKYEPPTEGKEKDN